MNDYRPDRPRWSLIVCLAFGVLHLGVGCAAEDDADRQESETEIVVATVNNPQMEELQQLLPFFHEEYPDIRVRIVLLPENQLREEATRSVVNRSDRYDLLTIGTYETPIWARAGWIESLQEFAESSESYDVDDLIPAVAQALSFDGELYAVPFYGESSMLMYRKDLLEEAGVTMPLNPTWEEVAAVARAVHDLDNGVTGICLRGLPGWGEIWAPLNTVVNTFGGRWFDLNWEPQLTSDEFEAAVTFYTDLIKDAGEAEAETFGYIECLKAYRNGEVAMWYDATVAASTFTGEIAENTGYAYAPTEVRDHSGWLWAWAFAIPVGTEKREAAWTFASWATSKEYIELVGSALGWRHVPPGTRTSTYEQDEYIEAAGDFSEITLESIAHADVDDATNDPVPYTGVQNLGIPEWVDLGDETSRQIARAIEGEVEVSEALEAGQQLAEEVGQVYR